MLKSLLVVSLTLFVNIESAPPSQNLNNPLLAPTETISLEGLDYLLKHAQNLFSQSKQHHQANDQQNSEIDLTQSLQPPIEKSYNFYLPVFLNDYEQKSNLQNKNLFTPPGKSSERINYYAIKPKKLPKKFSSTIKHVNLKPITKLQVKPYRQGKYFKNNEWEPMFGNVNIQNDDSAEDAQQQNQENHEQIIFDDSYFGLDDHVSIPEVVEQNEAHSSQNYEVKTSQQQQNENFKLNKDKKEVNLPTIPEKQNERIEYQMHGFAGPKSYKFGYDTGNGKDRQFHFEERDTHGDVIGQYGYLDENGKLKIIKYSATAETGFKIEY